MSEGWQEDLDGSATADLDAAADFSPDEAAETVTGGGFAPIGGPLSPAAVLTSTRRAAKADRSASGSIRFDTRRT